MMQPQEVNTYGEIPQKAFEYWNKTIGFQILFSLIYFVVFISLTIFVFNYYGITEKINAIAPYMNTDRDLFTQKYLALGSDPNFRLASYWTILFGAILFPLNIGMLNIYKKMDKKEPVSVGDLFVGYEGSSFFKYFGYGLFWAAMYYLCKTTMILAPVWVLLTLFVGPLMFFGQQNLSDALKLSAQAVQKNFVGCILTLFVGFFVSYSGSILCGVGLLFTFPFWNALLYVHYKKIFGEVN